MCTPPCSTCYGASYFYQCSTCLNTQASLINNSLCLQAPNYLTQLICTCLLILFITLPLMRKRSVTLIRIFDAIQIVAYFKYFIGYDPNRHNYLYLGMRSWGDWSEGWYLIPTQQTTSPSESIDSFIPVWINEESLVFNKLLRIMTIWVGVMVIMLLIGLIKTTTGDSMGMTFGNYMEKNWALAFTIGFYVNVQDIAFIMAAAYQIFMSTDGSLSATSYILVYAVGVVLTAVCLFIVLWLFSIINYRYKEQADNDYQSKNIKKIYPYINMFAFSLDYDLFPTYELTELPVNEKKIHLYSNIRIIDIVKKVFYSFLIISFLYSAPENFNLSDQRFSILALLIFFNLIWYVSLPYDLKTQYIQFTLGVITDLLVICILMIGQYFSTIPQMVHMILCLSLFLLAIVSCTIELTFDLYQLIPVDLYETGLNVVIQDKKLLEEIEQRKKLQEENDRKLREAEERNRKLMEELMEAQKEKKTSKENEKKSSHGNILREESQQSLPNIEQDDDQKLPKHSHHKDSETVQQQSNIPYHGSDELMEKDSMNSDDLVGLYKIDEHKRRKLYQFNKKANFIYSNKAE